MCLVCGRIPSLTPHAVKWELHCADINAILHCDGLMQGRTMILPTTRERQRAEDERERVAFIAAQRATPPIDLGFLE